MVDQCTHTELIARVVALETSLEALKELLNERDERYKLRSATQDAAVAAALSTSEKALAKADASTEKRFEGVNEFRQTLADQAQRLMPRAEYDAQHSALQEKFELLVGRINVMQQDISSILARGGGLKDAWGYLVAVGMATIAVAAVYFRQH